MFYIDIVDFIKNYKGLVYKRLFKRNEIQYFSLLK